MGNCEDLNCQFWDTSKERCTDEVEFVNSDGDLVCRMRGDAVPKNELDKLQAENGRLQKEVYLQNKEFKSAKTMLAHLIMKLGGEVKIPESEIISEDYVLEVSSGEADFYGMVFKAREKK